MKALIGAILFGLLSAVAVHSENERTVLEDQSPVFMNDKRALYEKPIFLLKIGDKVNVLADSSVNAHIMTADGRTGYLDRKKISESGKAVLSMDEIKVIGWLDNPEPVYILDFDNGEYKPIRVSRDFVMDPDFMKNVDKETFERENEIYYYKGYPSEAVNGK
jgi:hypothetical protein